jgi:hypothetical protein
MINIFIIRYYSTDMQRKSYEDPGRKRPLTCQGERAQRKSILLTPDLLLIASRTVRK